jgi:hypothetical protein
LAVTFADGTKGIVGFSRLLTEKDCGIFEALKDTASFEQVRLELGAVMWPRGADIDPAWMHEQVKKNKLWSVPFRFD